MRVANKVYMSANGGAIHTLTRKHINGKGMGSVLLDGGMGGASSGGSYSSVDDYINTTGVNPYSHSSSLGKGLKSMNSKIESLLVKSKKLNPKKDKNINFNI
jgi:hypothetical protein